MVASIFLVVLGFFIFSRLMWGAHNLSDRDLACAPIFCPGFVCHKCFTSLEERNRFCAKHFHIAVRRHACCPSWCNSDFDESVVEFQRLPVMIDDAKEVDLFNTTSSSDGSTGERKDQMDPEA